MSNVRGSVSQSAKDDLSRLLTHCLQSSLVSDGYSNWTLQPLAQAEEYPAQEFMMLTISSYDFRMFVLLHWTISPASLRYAAAALKMQRDQLTTERYYDFLGELGNRFCGAFKRDLGASFPYTGMSTPNRLRRESLKHVKNLSGTYETHINAKAHDDTSFCASLYVSNYSPNDFKLKTVPQAQPQNEVGELELF